MGAHIKAYLSLSQIGRQFFNHWFITAGVSQVVEHKAQVKDVGVPLVLGIVYENRAAKDFETQCITEITITLIMCVKCSKTINN